MNKAIIKNYIQKFSQNKKAVGFSISFVLLVLSDFLFANSMPYWIFPLIIGIGIGIYFQFPLGGIYTSLGAMLARFLTINIKIITTSGMLKTGDLFIAVISDVIEIPLPFGSFLIILLSIIICGFFSLLGGLLGGSATRISLYYLQNKKTGYP